MAVRRAARPPVWLPVAYSHATVMAAQALARGDATAGQQQAFLRWLVETAAGAYEMSYRSDADGGDRETAFAEGRRHVGLSVVKMVEMPAALADALRQKESKANG